MQEILVIYFGRMGLDVGGYLERELPIRVRSIVLGREVNWTGQNKRTLEMKAVELVRPYVGTVKVIVIANPVVALITGATLRREFPQQKIVGYEQGLAELLRETQRIFVLAPKEIRAAEQYQQLKAENSSTQVVEPDPTRWRWIIERGWLAADEKIKEIENLHGGKVVVFDTEMLPLMRDVEDMVGWRGEVVDLREKIVVMLKEELGLTAWKL